MGAQALRSRAAPRLQRGGPGDQQRHWWSYAAGQIAVTAKYGVWLTSLRPSMTGTPAVRPVRPARHPGGFWLHRQWLSQVPLCGRLHERSRSPPARRRPCSALLNGDAGLGYRPAPGRQQQGPTVAIPDLLGLGLRPPRHPSPAWSQTGCGRSWLPVRLRSCRLPGAVQCFAARSARTARVT